MSPIVSNFFARCIVRELQPDEAGWLALLEGTTQTPEAILWDNQMPLEEFNGILNNALRISGDPGLGLRFGRHSNLLALGESGLAAIMAPNIMEAVRSLGDFSRLQADYLDTDFQVDLQQLRIRGREHLPMGETRRTQHEVLILTLQNIVEMVLGRPATEARYYFSYPQPEYVDRYAEVFHSPCVFDAPETGVDIPRELCELPSPFYDQVLWEQGRNRCVALMEAYNDGQNQLYSHHILTALRSQTPPLPSALEVAQSLCLSERTLMRRLAEEGHTYRQLLNRVLQEWAHHYLIETELTVDAIALQLGYQDSANFRRAFKRWHGCSPSDYREQHSGKGI